MLFKISVVTGTDIAQLSFFPGEDEVGGWSCCWVTTRGRAVRGVWWARVHDHAGGLTVDVAA